MLESGKNQDPTHAFDEVQGDDSDEEKEGRAGKGDLIPAEEFMVSNSLFSLVGYGKHICSHFFYGEHICSCFFYGEHIHICSHTLCLW